MINDQAKRMMDVSLYGTLLTSVEHAKAYGARKDAAERFAELEIQRYISSNASYLGVRRDHTKEDMSELEEYGYKILENILYEAYR